MDDGFADLFRKLTGNAPFPWQRRLYEEWFARGNFPDSCKLPTGLGKTNVIAVWLIALIQHPKKIPRRLVYVVNRRTVVDQTTDEVVKLHQNLPKLPNLPKHVQDLAISTLRGEFADNRAWSANPSRPAVICGTIDMIGSRLLFNGYGVGFKGKPLQAAFLGQDSLIVHDEAHLEPAFQELLLAIEKEQHHGRSKDYCPLRVMELSATSRGNSGNSPFELTQQEKDATKKSPGVLGIVGARLRAEKRLYLEPVDDAKKCTEKLAAKAMEFKHKNRAVLVFARTVKDVKEIAKKFPKERVETLTGTMRGKERDRLVTNRVFQRFLPGGESNDDTTWLVCTSAGEVGVNISADHLICDLSTFDSMAQRFGRVNRFGKRTDTEIHVIHPTDKGFDEKNNYDQSRQRTLHLLRELKDDAGPAALDELNPESRLAAFAPTPIILPTSDILFDAWALTTLKGKLPGRPEVEPYLHGLPTEWQPPETQVAWRKEVAEISSDMLIEYDPVELLGEYPLKPHELLRDRFDSVHKELGNIAKRWEGKVWLLRDDESVDVVDLSELADKDSKDRLRWATVILPPAAGGLSTSGMLDGDALPPSEGSLDVADELFLKNDKGEPVCQRKRIWNDDWDAETNSMHEVVIIHFPGPKDDEDAEGKTWHWLRLYNEGDLNTKRRPVLWSVHVGDVEREAAKIVDALPLSDELKNALKQAAKYHDHGKRRALFQLVLGNTDPNICLAKSGKKGSVVQECYRHEFGSLLDIQQDLESLKLGEHQDLVLHLIATHHGRARPHFPLAEAFDPERSQADADLIASEVPRRFARLQRKYGRWGLAYLESLLRAADWAASGNPSAYYEGEE